jgi:hydrogenase maturation protease
MEHTKEQSPPPEKKGKKGEKKKRMVILGVGNLLLSDEGVGVHVANKMLEMDLPTGIEVYEGGTDGFRLMNLVSEADRMVVVDAVKGGGDPGSIYRFDIKDAPSSPDKYKTSVHQIGILEVVHFSEFVGDGNAPETTVIGVEPKSLDMSMELSPEISEKVPRVIELVMEEVQKFLDQE